MHTMLPTIVELIFSGSCDSCPTPECKAVVSMLALVVSHVTASK